MTLDALLLHAILSHRWAGLAPLVHLCTRFTGEKSVMEWAVAGGLGLGIFRRWADAAYLFLGTAFGLALIDVLKSFIGRARPPGIVLASPSFPSGHAMGSTILFSLTAWLLCRGASAYAPYWIALAALLTFFSGYCRLYLGVHWPSDVLAGWILGALYAYTWTQGYKRLRQSNRHF